MTRSSSRSWRLCTWARCPAIVLRVNSDNQCDPKEGSWPIPAHTYGSNFQWNHKRNCRNSLQLSTTQDLAANGPIAPLEMKMCTCKLGDRTSTTLYWKTWMENHFCLLDCPWPSLFPPKPKTSPTHPYNLLSPLRMQLYTVPTLVSGSLKSDPTLCFPLPQDY